MLKDSDPPDDTAFTGRLGSEAESPVWQDLLGKRTSCYRGPSQSRLPGGHAVRVYALSFPNPGLVCPAHPLNRPPRVLTIELEKVCCRSQSWTHLLPNPPYGHLRDPGGSEGKKICLQCRRLGFDPWVGKIPWRREYWIHSSILAWKILWTEEPGGLASMGLQRVRHN